jgi:hypothetical protein
MSFRALKLAGLSAVPVALLGGCATTAYPPRYAYYRVPCNTPGAVVAEPIDSQAAAPSAANVPPTCVVAISDASYGRGYSSYYPGGYYGRPYYGSIGIGIGLGSIHHHDLGGGHFGGGHFGGGHGGSHGGHH